MNNLTKAITGKAITGQTIAGLSNISFPPSEEGERTNWLPIAQESFELAGGVFGRLTLRTGECATIFDDIDVGNASLPVMVSHTHKRSGEDFGCGRNWRLSLHQRLERDGDENSGNRVYTDATGARHYFEEAFYYEFNGRKIKVNRADIIVGADGKMTHHDVTIGTFEVYREFLSSTDLNIHTRLEGLCRVEYFEQRMDEERQIEETIKNHEEALNNLVVVDVHGNDIIREVLRLSFPHHSMHWQWEGFWKGVVTGDGRSHLVMDRKSALQLNALILQHESLGTQQTGLALQGASLFRQHNIMSIEQDRLNRTFGCPVCLTTTETNTLITSNPSRSRSHRTAFQRCSNCGGSSGNDGEFARKSNNLDAQLAIVNSQRESVGTHNAQGQVVVNPAHNTQANDLRAMRNNLWDQIEFIRTQARNNRARAEQLFKDYVGALEKLRILRLQLPKSFVQNGNINLGFNFHGNLCAIIDGNDNFVSIDYGRIQTSTGERDVIIGTADEEGQRSIFEYNRLGLLTSITNPQGSRVNYVYDDARNLTRVNFENDEWVTFSYQNNNHNLFQIDAWNRIRTTLSYGTNTNILTGISNISLIDGVKDDGEKALPHNVQSRALSEYNIRYNNSAIVPASHVVIEKNKEENHYYLDSFGSLKGNFSRHPDVVFGPLTTWAFSERPMFSYLSPNRKWGYNVKETDGIQPPRQAFLSSSVTTSGSHRLASILSGSIWGSELRSTMGGKNEIVFMATARASVKPRPTDEAFMASFIETPQNDNSPKYQIRAVVHGNKQSTFIASFDPKIQDEQIVMLPITFEPNHLRLGGVLIEFFVEFSGHGGEATFDNFSLAPCEWEYFEMNDFENVTKRETSAVLISDIGGQAIYAKAITPENGFVYNERRQLVSERTDNIVFKDSGTISTSQLVTEYSYTSQGQLTRTENYIAGEERERGRDVSETLYDSRGKIIREISYNTLASTDKAIIEYESNKSEEAESNANERGYGFDRSGRLTSISESTEEGEANTNNIRYNRGLATRLTFGRNTVNYEYEHRRRVSKVLLNDEERMNYLYDDGNFNISTVTIMDSNLNSGNPNIPLSFDGGGDDNDRQIKIAPHPPYDGEGLPQHSEGNYYIIPNPPPVSVEFKGEANGNRVRAMTASAQVSTNGQNEVVTNEVVTDRRGRVRRIDKRSNVTGIMNQSNTQVAYNYNEDDTISEIGEIVLPSIGNGQITKYEYYPATKQVKKISNSNLTEDYSYNNFGLLINRSLTLNGTLNRTHEFTYKPNVRKDLESMTLLGDLIYLPQTDVNGRNTGKIIERITEGENALNVQLHGEYIYYRKHGDRTTGMPSTIRYGRRKNNQFVMDESMRYTYDSMDNITEIRENGELTIRYEYDTLGRLIREDNKTLKKTYVFSYDNNGNILSKRETKITLKKTDEIDFTSKNLYAYQADNSDWLSSFNGEEITYNAVGNPLNYRGNAIRWGRGHIIQYSGLMLRYDGFGRRIRKGPALDNMTSYIYDSQGVLLRQEKEIPGRHPGLQGSQTVLDFIRDGDGLSMIRHRIRSFLAIGEGIVDYIVRKNIQGDVTHLLDMEGNIVVQYVYDAWGNHVVLDVNGQEITDQNHIGNINPYRYRSYLYDPEIKLYWLNTRFYDPETGRFISADNVSFLEPTTINGLNLYAYCGGDPVNNIDPNGTFFTRRFWRTVGDGFRHIGRQVGNFFTSVGKTIAGGLMAIGGGFLTALGVITSFIPGVRRVSGFLTQTGISLMSYGTFMVASAFDDSPDGIRADMRRINWNPFNRCAETALRSNRVSFYRGAPVVRYGDNGLNEGFSFGLIGLGRGVTDPDFLRHERGHNTQLMLAGPLRYGLFIAIPSLISVSICEEAHRRAPWERSANVFGRTRDRNEYPHMNSAAWKWLLLLLI